MIRADDAMPSGALDRQLCRMASCAADNVPIKPRKPDRSLIVTGSHGSDVYPQTGNGIKIGNSISKKGYQLTCIMFGKPDSPIG